MYKVNAHVLCSKTDSVKIELALLIYYNALANRGVGARKDAVIIAFPILNNLFWWYSFNVHNLLAYLDADIARAEDRFSVKKGNMTNMLCNRFSGMNLALH